MAAHGINRDVSDRSCDGRPACAAEVRERQRSSRSTLLCQLAVEVTAAPTSRAGLGTSTVGGAWNARIAGSELAFEAMAARILVHDPGPVAGGGTRGGTGGEIPTGWTVFRIPSTP